MAFYYTSSGELFLGDIMPIDGLGHFTVNGDAPMTTEHPTVITPYNYRVEIMSYDPDITGYIESLIGTEYDTVDDAIDDCLTNEDYIYLSQNLHWQWGSLDSGGLAFANINGTKCRVLLCLGIYEVNNKYRFNIQNFEFDYHVLIDNSEILDAQNVPCPPVNNGSYENGIIFYQMWDWNDAQEMAEYTQFIGVGWGAIPVIQSYATTSILVPGQDDAFVYQEVVFSDTAQHVADNWTNYFTQELPQDSMWDHLVPTYGYKYYQARSLQRKIYNVQSLITTFAESKSGNLFGGAERNADDYSGTPSTTGGGGGNQNRYSEPIDADGLPSEDLLDCGFVNLYNPSKAECKDFVNYLYADISSSVVDAIQNMLTNPLEAVLFAHMIHFRPHISGMQTITFCGYPTDCQAYVVDKQYYESKYQIEINEWWNSFFDYDRTKMKVFLPYIGIRDVEAKHFMNANMKITYKWDIVSGMCTALIYSIKTTQRGGGNFSAPLYQFSGNFVLPIPMTSANWSSLFSTLVNSAGAIMNPVGAIQGALGSLSSPMMSVQHSGNISANAGYSGYQEPYLILLRPDISNPSHYSYLQGYPCNVTYTLSNFVQQQAPKSGGWYIKAKGEVYTGHIKCTDEERNMIKQALLDGVWIRKENNS